MKAPFFSRLCCKAGLAAIAACSLQSIHAQTTIKDMAGRSVTVPAKVERIVGLGPGALRLISYLQATDKVVGVEDIDKGSPVGRPYALANPELAKLPPASKGGPAEINKKPDLEALLSVNPQVIFVTYMQPAVAHDVQKTLGVPVVVLSYGDGLGTFNKTLQDSLTLAGKIVQREQRAASVNSFIQQAQQDLQKRVASIKPEQRLSAYVGGIGQRGAHGIESTEQNYAPFDWAGVNNLSKQFKSDTGTYLKLDKEALLKLNPPVIFVDSGGWDVVRADYAKNPQYYQALQAFQKGQTYRLHPFNMYTTNIDTVIAGAYAVGKAMYPKQFADVDVAKKADAIYTFMLGKPVYAQMQANHGALGEKISFK